MIVISYWLNQRWSLYRIQVLSRHSFFTNVHYMNVIIYFLWISIQSNLCYKTSKKSPKSGLITEGSYNRGNLHGSYSSLFLKSRSYNRGGLIIEGHIREVWLYVVLCLSSLKRQTLTSTLKVAQSPRKHSLVMKEMKNPHNKQTASTFYDINLEFALFRNHFIRLYDLSNILSLVIFQLFPLYLCMYRPRRCPVYLPVKMIHWSKQTPEGFIEYEGCEVAEKTLVCYKGYVKPIQQTTNISVCEPGLIYSVICTL